MKNDFFGELRENETLGTVGYLVFNLLKKYEHIRPVFNLLKKYENITGYQK